MSSLEYETEKEKGEGDTMATATCDRKTNATSVTSATSATSVTISEHLALIASLRPGETLSLGSPRSLPRAVPKGSPTTSLWRYWSAESWGKTFHYIENVFLTASTQPRLKGQVKAAVAGLQALQATYSSRREAVLALFRLQSRVEREIALWEEAAVEQGTFVCQARKQEKQREEEEDFVQQTESVTSLATTNGLSLAVRQACHTFRPYMGAAQQAARVAAIVACFL